MCDYSLQSVKTRSAQAGDKLMICSFGTGTRGFAAVGEPGVAVCLLPGTELAFESGLEIYGIHTVHKTGLFQQINKEDAFAHHDCVELLDGKRVYLTHMAKGQEATVLQLPAAPRTEQEALDQTRLEVVG